MIIGPKYKICKRLGSAVFEKCQTQKFQLAEARAPRRTSKRGGRGGSVFGTQLIEKQKARFTYGLAEKQFSRYVHEAMEKKGVSAAQAFVSRLEARLDNAVFRAGFAPTRRAARQIVSHGHITVNGRRVTIPSYKISPDEVIAIREASRQSPYFGTRAEKAAESKTPAWLALEEGGFSARVTAQPGAAPSELAFDPAVIVQFYSR